MMTNVQKLRKTYKRMSIEVAKALNVVGDADTKEDYLKLTEKMCRDVDAKFYMRIHKILTAMEAEGMSPKQMEKTIGDVIINVVMSKEFIKNIDEIFDDEIFDVKDEDEA